MADEPNAITTLKRFYSDRLVVPDPEAMTKELAGGNDRSSIITIASVADAALEFQLALKIPMLAEAGEKLFNHAFRFDGPLGPFSHRIELATYVGIIDDRLNSQLSVLRAMRNAVAHTSRPVTFNDKPLQNAAKRLFHPVGMFKPPSNSAEHIRQTFLVEGSFIQPVIHDGRDQAVETLREVLPESGNADALLGGRMAR